MRPAVDYRRFRWNELDSEEFRHLKLLLFWPLFGLAFLYLERLHTPAAYTLMHCALDDIIPLCEYFLIPYLFWFVFLVGMHLYTLLYDTETFRRMMRYIILTYVATAAIYLAFPTAQALRPPAFERDNLFIRFLGWFYTFDTNTNVCPSLHVIGSLAVMFAAWNSKAFRTPAWKAAFGATAALISLSTVFLKQHSVLDILAALPICLLAYPLSYGSGAMRWITLRKNSN